MYVGLYMKNNEMILMALQTIFKCKNCGNYCKNEKAINICQEDIKKMAKYMKMSYKKFRINYVRSEGDKLFIKNSEPCIFYDDNKCTIYEARPLICRMYPYITMNSDFSNDTVPVIDGCIGSMEASKYYMDFWNKIIDRAQKEPEILKALNILKEKYKGRQNEIVDEMRES